MNPLFDFLSSPAGKVLAVSSVLAALITSIIGLLNIRMTNKHLLEVEKNSPKRRGIVFQVHKAVRTS